MASELLPDAVTRVQMAQILGIKKDRVSQLVVSQILVTSGSGKGTTYPLTDNVRRYIAYQIDCDRNANRTEGQLTKEQVDIRKGIAQARKAEVEADLVEGKVIPIEDSDAVLSKILGAVRSELSQIPGRWTPQLLAVTDYGEMCRRLERETDKMFARTLDNVDGLLTEIEIADSTTDSETEPNNTLSTNSEETP